MNLLYLINDIYPISEAIISLLPYIDRYALAQTTKCVLENHPNLLMFSDIIKDRLIERMGPINAQTFLEMLRETKSVIFGSFLLECLYGPENWYSGDLDVMAPLSNSPPGWGDLVNTQNKLQKFLNNANMDNQRESQHLDCHYAAIVKKFILKANADPLHIDYVTVFPERSGYQVKTIQEYHERHADLTISQMFYDGKKLYIKNVDEVFARRSRYQTLNSRTRYFWAKIDVWAVTKYQIMHKYKTFLKKIFHFYFFNYGTLVEKLEERPRKYMKRGIFVECPDYHEMINTLIIDGLTEKIKIIKKFYIEDPTSATSSLRIDFFNDLIPIRSLIPPSITTYKWYDLFHNEKGHLLPLTPVQRLITAYVNTVIIQEIIKQM